MKDMNDSTLHKLIKDNWNYAVSDNQDWMTVVSGREGSGKSMMAAWIACTLNEGFKPENQVIYDVDSFIRFLESDDRKKGDVAWFDEACLHFLGEESTTLEAKRFKKIFITHRDYGFYYILCSPSPWLLTPYIRNWRVRDFVLVYVDGYSNDNHRNYAYYTKKAYAPMITSSKGKSQIMIPSEFVKVHKPTSLEMFPKLSDKKYNKIFDEVFAMKKEAQKAMRDEIKQIIEDVGHEDGATAKHIEKRDVKAYIDWIVSSNKWTGTKKELITIASSLKLISKDYYNSINCGRA